MPNKRTTDWIVQFIILFGVIAAITELVRFRWLRLAGIIAALLLIPYYFTSRRK